MESWLDLDFFLALDFEEESSFFLLWNGIEWNNASSQVRNLIDDRKGHPPEKDLKHSTYLFPEPPLVDPELSRLLLLRFVTIGTLLCV